MLFRNVSDNQFAAGSLIYSFYFLNFRSLLLDHARMFRLVHAKKNFSFFLALNLFFTAEGVVVTCLDFFIFFYVEVFISPVLVTLFFCFMLLFFREETEYPHAADFI